STSSFLPTATTFPSLTATASAMLNFASTVTTLALWTIRSAGSAALTTWQPTRERPAIRREDFIGGSLRLGRIPFNNVLPRPDPGDRRGAGGTRPPPPRRRGGDPGARQADRRGSRPGPPYLPPPRRSGSRGPRHAARPRSLPRGRRAGQYRGHRRLRHRHRFTW